MAHGANCHCIMCTVGKKMGMIPRGDQPKVGAEGKSSAKVCRGCGHEHRADHACDCGCQ